MNDLPATWTALCALALLFGARHGFDADHLATIDGLTRFNSRSNPRLARRCGALFSLGHGAVVIAVAAFAGTLASRWQTPAWLEATGVGVSAAFLFGLAFVNVRAVVAADAGAVVATAGLQSRLLGRVTRVRRGWAVAAVGALFALSFDTVTQAALFALAAGRFGGIAAALFVATLFVLGMLAVDGANGVWISRLIRRADRTAAIASRAIALGVAAVSTAVGVLTVAKLVVPALDAWAEGRGIALGVAVVASVLAAFAVGMRAAASAARS